MISAGIFGYPLEDAWRKAIQACMDFEKSTGHSMEIVFAVLDKRIIEMGNKVLTDLGYTGRGTSFEHLLLSGRLVNAVFFHLPEEPYGFLSNWCLSPFDLDGIHYSSMEQYIMYQKCVFFGDQDTAQKVLLTDDPLRNSKSSESSVPGISMVCGRVQDKRSQCAVCLQSSARMPT